VPLLLEAWHRGAIARHVVFAGELSTHGATEGGVLRHEAVVLDSPH
jgi:hypothetical protein